MDVGRVLSRAFHITRTYPVLWLFGFLLAVTGGGGGRSGVNFSFPGGGGTESLPRFTPPDQVTLILIALLVLFLFLVWLVLALYFRFVARGSLIGGVRDVEAGGSVTLRAAWQTGQANYGRLLGLGLLVNLPLAVLFLILFGLALLPLIPTIISVISLVAAGSAAGPDQLAPALGGMFFSIISICCLALLFALITLAVHPIYEMAARAVVLDSVGVVEGWRRGWRRVREHLGDVLILYICLIGARIGYGLAVAVVAIPGVVLIVALAFATVNLGLVAFILALVVTGIPFFLILSFLEALFETFEGAAWTLAYAGPESVPAKPIVKPGPQVQEAASESLPLPGAPGQG